LFLQFLQQLKSIFCDISEGISDRTTAVGKLKNRFFLPFPIASNSFCQYCIEQEIFPRIFLQVEFFTFIEKGLPIL